MFDQLVVNALSTACHLDLDLIPHLEDLYRSESGALAEEPFSL
jgi:hypothetical protein